MSDQQFQTLLAFFGFIGALMVLLLSIIAFFVRGFMVNVNGRLSSHSQKHEKQGEWNEATSKTLSAHGTKLHAHEKKLFPGRG